MRLIRTFLAVVLFIVGITAVSCTGSSSKNDGGGNFDVAFRVPEEATIEFGAVTFDFRVQFQKAPAKTDKIVFENSAKEKKECEILSVSETKFTIALFDGISSGAYEISIKRGSRVKSMGTMNVTIKGDGVDPEKGSTVYGKISCDGKGVAGVVVSDGFEVACTDANGVYQLPSDKELKYVFMSVPSGYEPASEGILPKMFSALEKKADVAERKDFILKKVDNQDKYKVFFLGDMHLANRTKDLSQFTAFTNDWNNYRDSHKNEKMYAITLGDMTWDYYWYKNNYQLPQYVDDMNRRVSDILIYHTMGNHDNDMNAEGNWNAKLPYVNTIAPDYYSFNIGKVHYIVLDDIDCKFYNGDKSRNYVKDLPQEQIDWLKKDLQYVDKSTPLVIMMHAQVFLPKSESAFKIDHDASSTNAMFDAVRGYKVHYVTGHTHTIFNVTPKEASSLGAAETYEHNSGSICASWWWSGNLTEGVYVGLDGTPGGYSIWDVNGTDFKWKYKATAKEENYQFRSYDLNNVSFSYDDVPKLKDSGMKLEFAKYIAAYPSLSKRNEVLINVWNWSSDWTLEVKDETGKKLEWTRCYAYDPLHIKALTVKRFNEDITKTPAFVTEKKMPHFFMVKADDANVDLTIKVTDPFGNVYTENMARPKAFNSLTDSELKKY